MKAIPLLCLIIGLVSLEIHIYKLSHHPFDPHYMKVWLLLTWAFMLFFSLLHEIIGYGGTISKQVNWVTKCALLSNFSMWVMNYCGVYGMWSMFIAFNGLLLLTSFLLFISCHINGLFKT